MPLTAPKAEPVHARERSERTEIASARLAIRAFSPVRIFIPILLVGIGVGHYLWVDTPYSVIWFLVFAVSFVAQYTLTQRFLTAKPPSIRLLRPVLISNGISASLWAIGLALMWEHGDPYNQLFILISLSTSLIGAATMTAPHRQMSLMLMAPMSIALISLLATEGGVVYSTMSFMAIVFVFLSFSVSRQAGEAAREALILREDKNALIEELETAREHSDQARFRAEAANRAKSEFLANMSHELRTPLNAVIGFSEIMKLGALGPLNNPTYEEYASDIHASGLHLLGLINDILDLAKIEAGQSEISPSTIEAAKASADALRMVKPRAEKAALALNCDIERDLTLCVDPRAFRQILLNLLSNAIKFTPPGGEIALEGRRLETGETLITVRDTGIGIDPSDHERVFQSFGQGRHDVALPDRGTGLGLPIVKGLVEAHDGQVSLESALGKGTIVRITFPATCRVPSAEHVAAA